MKLTLSLALGLAGFALGLPNNLMEPRGAFVKKESPCPEGFHDWLAESNYCYVLSHDYTNWDGAKEGCTALGASLIRTESSAEILAISDAMYEEHVHGIWLDIRRTGPGPKDWKWNSTGEEPSADAVGWGPGQPHNGRGNEDCVVQWDGNGMWFDFRCVYRFNYGCMVEKPPKITEPHQCPCPSSYENWVEEGNYCYKLPAEAQGDFVESANICRDENDGGSLAFILNAAENEAIADKLKELGSDANSVLDLQGNTAWTTWHYAKLPLNYTSWAVDEESKMRCAYLQQDGFWVDKECTEKSNVLCMKQKTDCLNLNDQEPDEAVEKVTEEVVEDNEGGESAF